MIIQQHDALRTVSAPVNVLLAEVKTNRTLRVRDMVVGADESLR